MTGYLILGAIALVGVLIIIIMSQKIKAQSKEISRDEHLVHALEDVMKHEGEVKREKKKIGIQSKEIKKNIRTIDIDRYADGLQNIPKRTDREDKISDG